MDAAMVIPSTRFYGMRGGLATERVKVSKDDDRKIQDLVMLQARKAGVV